MAQVDLVFRAQVQIQGELGKAAVHGSLLLSVLVHHHFCSFQSTTVHLHTSIDLKGLRENAGSAGKYQRADDRASSKSVRKAHRSGERLDQAFSGHRHYDTHYEGTSHDQRSHCH